MLAKCYWKMYQTPIELLDGKDKTSPIAMELVLDTVKKALDVAYNARKSRSSEPILEPHYKLVSILHKLVIRQKLSSVEAAETLSKQPFGIPINPDDLFASFSEPEDWEEYIIRNLSKLRDKDRSNWHHRIIMRHAKILFDEGNQTQAGDNVEARAAFGILRESMFTKTMVMNVWKCDFERPGRHHVYTEQYVRFMTKLLIIMGDRINLEMLLRRLRKKGADFYHFTDLWQSCCIAYLGLLRQTYRVSESTDDVFKSMWSEEFEIISDRITEWAATEGAQIPVFNCMRDALELKKLNANLTKAAPIDDLLNDCYSKIYLEVAKTLPGPEPRKVIEERNHAKEVAAQLEAAARAEAKPTSSLSSILNPPNGQTSLTGTATPMETEKTEAAPRARRTGVRRPDVLRKAEQAVVRSMDMPKPSKSRVNSMSSGKNGNDTPNPAASDAGSDAGSDDEGPDAQVRREAGEHMDVEMKDVEANEDVEDVVEEDPETDARAVESEPGSIHDSADDESDLSDLSDVPEGYDEEVPPGLLFHHLEQDPEGNRSSGEDADSESEGDEEAEESGGEEEAEEAAEEAEEAEDEEERDEDEGEGEEEEHDDHGNEDTEMAEDEIEHAGTEIE